MPRPGFDECMRVTPREKCVREHRPSLPHTFRPRNHLRLHSKKLDSGNAPHFRQLYSTFNNQSKELCGVGLMSRPTRAPVYSEVPSISPPVRLIQQNTHDERRVSCTIWEIRTSNYYINTTMRIRQIFTGKTRMRY